MRQSNFALRVEPTLLDELRQLAKEEGVAVNQLINTAIAEKVSAIRTARYFAARLARADIARGRTILRKAGLGNRPDRGDERPTQNARKQTPGQRKTRRRAA